MEISKLTDSQKKTRRRIIELSHQSNLAHLGSCLSAVDIIDSIYQIKKKNERFVLSGGHAAIALYAVLEKNHIIDAAVIKDFYIHPDRNIDCGIDCSSGSLGQGLPIALGMALADKNKRIFCIITDGECAEGSIWESLRVIYERRVNNLIIIVNANGWAAYDSISLPVLLKRIKGFGFEVIITDGHDINKLLEALETASKNFPSVIFAKTDVEQLPFLKGQDAHYYIMTREDYELAVNILK